MLLGWRSFRRHVRLAKIQLFWKVFRSRFSTTLHFSDFSSSENFQIWSDARSLRQWTFHCRGNGGVLSLEMLFGWRSVRRVMSDWKNPTFLKSVQNRILYTFSFFGFFGAPRFSGFGAAPDRRLKFHPPFDIEPLVWEPLYFYTWKNNTKAI